MLAATDRHHNRDASCARQRASSVRVKTEGEMTSSLVNRSIRIAGRNTSIALEREFWEALREIAGRRDVSLAELVAVIDAEQRGGPLSSAIRLFVLGFYCDQVLEQERRSRTRQTLANAARPATVPGQQSRRTQ
jgi:predicted DNA-binding ribbon-helix-helix protein